MDTKVAIQNTPTLQLSAVAAGAILSDVTFSPEMKLDAMQIATDFKIANVSEAGVYGNRVMQEFNRAISALLADVRMGDIGKIGDIVSGVQDATERMRLRALYEEIQEGTWRNRLARIPLIGGMLSTAKYFLEQRDQFLDLTAKMERSITSRQQGIRDHNRKLDSLLSDLEKLYRALAVHIIAGELILRDGAAEYEALTVKARETRDPLLYAQLQREHEKLQAFDVRLMSLKTAYVNAPTTALQTQIGQSAQRMTVEHLANILDFVIPALKMAVAQAEGMVQLSSARAEADRIQKTTDEVSAVGIDMLRENYLGGKKAQGDTFDRAALLGQTIAKISDIIAAGRTLDIENGKRREQAERLLADAMASQRKVIEGFQAPAQADVAA